MKPTMTADDLLAAGFKKHSAGPHYPEREALYQKKIRAEDGTCLFFVNVYALRWPDRMPEAARDRHRWSIGAQLYRDGLTMDLTLHHEPGVTPAEIEAFYRTAHAVLGCTCDPHND